MVKKKGTSKRKTLSQKYKIDRKVKEHKRKERKEARKNPNGARKKKDPGIPNSMPWKAEVLAEIEYAKKRAVELKEEQKVKRHQELQRRRGLLPEEPATLQSLAAQAESKAHEFATLAQNTPAVNADDGVTALHERGHGEQSRRAYLRVLRKVVDKSDVVLQVLDARDPIGSRGTAVENVVLSKPGKRLVFVLNKVDLVPKDVVAQWLKHLRAFHPTIAFKASTQGSGRLQQGSGDAQKADEAALSRSGSVGAEALMGLLKNYCRSLDIKTAITVGVIGYPNVGKSSLINSLKRSKAVGVSSTPGFTKSLQEVTLDKMVKLLDSPGVVFDDSDSSAVLLRNCVDTESLPDPTPAVAAVLAKCTPEQLMQVYEIPRFEPADVQAFLASVAKKSGKLLKGGTPDRIAAGRMVLRDWNSGKVPYYTVPPTDAEAQASSTTSVTPAERAMLASSVQFMDAFSAEFDPLAIESCNQEMSSYDFPAVPAHTASHTADTHADMDTDSESESEAQSHQQQQQISNGTADMEDGASDAESDDNDADMPLPVVSAVREPVSTRKDKKAAAKAAAEASKGKSHTSSSSVSEDPFAVSLPVPASLDSLLSQERALNPRIGADKKRALKTAKKQTRRQQVKAEKSARLANSIFTAPETAAGHADQSQQQHMHAELSDDDDL